MIEDPQGAPFMLVDPEIEIIVIDIVSVCSVRHGFDEIIRENVPERLLRSPEEAPVRQGHRFRNRIATKGWRGNQNRGQENNHAAHTHLPV